MSKPNPILSLLKKRVGKKPDKTIQKCVKILTGLNFKKASRNSNTYTITLKEPEAQKGTEIQVNLNKISKENPLGEIRVVRPDGPGSGDLPIFKEFEILRDYHTLHGGISQDARNQDKLTIKATKMNKTDQLRETEEKVPKCSSKKFDDVVAELKIFNDSFNVEKLVEISKSLGIAPTAVTIPKLLSGHELDRIIHCVEERVYGKEPAAAMYRLNETHHTYKYQHDSRGEDEIYEPDSKGNPPTVEDSKKALENLGRGGVVLEDGKDKLDVGYEIETDRQEEESAGGTDPNDCDVCSLESSDENSQIQLTTDENKFLTDLGDLDDTGNALREMMRDDLSYVRGREEYFLQQEKIMNDCQKNMFGASKQQGGKWKDYYSKKEVFIRLMKPKAADVMD